MAAAEARTAWQRTVNRCFVQEDAKRAPKLACCQSSSSTSKQVEAGPGTTTDGPDAVDAGFRPLHRNSSYGNLPPDSRWWLLTHPSHVYQNGLACEHLNALDTKVTETLQTEILNSTLDISKSGLQKGAGAPVDGNKNKRSYRDVLCDTTFCMNKAPEDGNQDVNARHSKNMVELLELDVITDGYDMVEKDHTEYVDAKQPNETFDSEYSWIGSEKTDPWWRMTHRDELVSLIAQKSHDNVENCDLPPPQKPCHRKHPYAHTRCFDSSLDWKSRADGLSNSSVHAQGSPGFGGTHGRKRNMTKEEHSHDGSANPFSCGTTQNRFAETQENYEIDYNKEQLMEALCHSQTRAREAERAAKQAYAEKEHILTLFFRQASQLFAYKQWFQMLQLETLYIEIKNNDPQTPTIFPVVLPWMSHKGRKLKKSLHRGKWVKRGGTSRDITKYAVSFSLGLSLVGAGLLLGWTVGWMLPPF